MITKTEIKSGETSGASAKKKNIFILLILLILAVVVIILALDFKIKTKKEVPLEKPSVETPDRPLPSAEVIPDNPELKDAKIYSLEGAKVVIPGANPITIDNKVVTPEGRIASSTERPMEGNAPRQTGFLSKEDLPASLFKLEVGNGKFSPSEFETRVGAPTSFSLTGVDSVSHLIAFDDPALAAVIIMVGPGQTKAITFNAPETPGEYTFRCDAPGHAENGEKGKMVVK